MRHFGFGRLSSRQPRKNNFLPPFRGVSLLSNYSSTQRKVVGLLFPFPLITKPTMPTDRRKPRQLDLIRVRLVFPPRFGPPPDG